ncbi:hypothetical protein VTO73DRAFT_11606 [Trametes versicolor]
MPTSYDILGLIFGVLSLSGAFKHVYAFLKSRQPPARAAQLAVALDEARSRAEKLKRQNPDDFVPEAFARHYPGAHSNGAYREAIDRLEQDTHVLLCKATDPEYAPKSPVAVLIYIVQHGIECDLSRHIGSRIEEVWDIYAVMGQHAIHLGGYPPEFVRNHKAYKSAQVAKEIFEVPVAVTTPCGARRRRGWDIMHEDTFRSNSVLDDMRVVDTL